MTEKSTNDHTATVMVPLNLTEEGRWQLGGSGENVSLTGSRYCKGACHTDHASLPTVQELIEILMAKVEPDYVCVLQYDDENDSRHDAFTYSQADTWAREHVFDCGFRSAEVRDRSGRTLARHELPDDWRETADV